MDAKSLFPFPGDPGYEARVLDRYFAGESSDEERQAIDRWIETNPGLADKVATLRYKARYPSGARPLPAATDLLAGFRAKIELEQRRNSGSGLVVNGPESEHMSKFLPSVRHPHPRPTHFRPGLVGNAPHLRPQILRRWVYATLVTITTALALLIGRKYSPNDSGVTRTYATTTGQQATVTLDDGTRITLAPQTILRLTGYGRRSRTVTLDGEAYFENAHTTVLPFVVRSGPISTRVLGTTFLVRSYSSDVGARVVVTTGKVNVSSTTARFNPVVLTAGQVGDVADSIITVHSGDDLASEAGWMQGRLFFRHTPVPELLATLNRWYGYQFRCTDPVLLRGNVTVVVSTQSSAAALAILEQVLNANLTVVGDTVTLTPRATQSVQGKTRMQGYDIWTPTREAGR